MLKVGYFPLLCTWLSFSYKAQTIYECFPDSQELYLGTSLKELVA